MLKYTKEFIDCVEDCLAPESTSQQLEEMGVLTERALSARRHAGTGPKYRRRWGRVFYRRADVVRFLRNHYQLPEVDTLPEEPELIKVNAKNIIKFFQSILEEYFRAFRPGDEPRDTKLDLSILHIKNLLECC